MAATTFTSQNPFTNAQAQDFLFQLETRGATTIDGATDPPGRMSVPKLQRLLAAGETIATANGHPLLPPDGSTLVEEWLFESQYLPPDDLGARCADRIEKVLENAAWAKRTCVSANHLHDLLTRLRLPPRKAKRKPPKQDRKAFRKLLQWVNFASGEKDPGSRFDRRGNASVYLYYVNLNAACKLINYRTVAGLELPLNERNEPRELASGLPVLLRGWRKTLKYVLIDDVPDATVTPNRPRYKALAGCQEELASIPLLEKFVTTRLFFDDTLLESVCQNPKLVRVQIKMAEITRESIQTLARCRSLRVINIVRCPEFPPAFRDELVTCCPHAERITVH